MSDARIITVCGSKGGGGKSCVSMQLAGSLALRGLRVLVADADPQGTSLQWSQVAPEDRPFPATVVSVVSSMTTGAQRVNQTLRQFIGSYDVIIVDTPPAIESKIPASALLVSDLAIVPLIASPPDLWAGVGIRRTIEDAQAINEALVGRAVINQIQATSVARDVLDILPQFGMDLFAAMLRHRTVYRESVAQGTTVHGLGRRGAEAAAEVDALAHEVLAIIAPEFLADAPAAAVAEGTV